MSEIKICGTNQRKSRFLWTFPFSVVCCCAKGGACMDTIKELYYGNINPYERDVKPDSETDKLAKLVLRLDE